MYVCAITYHTINKCTSCYRQYIKDMTPTHEIEHLRQAPVRPLPVPIYSKPFRNQTSHPDHLAPKPSRPLLWPYSYSKPFPMAGCTAVTERDPRDVVACLQWHHTRKPDVLNRPSIQIHFGSTANERTSRPPQSNPMGRYNTVRAASHTQVILPKRSSMTRYLRERERE